jgi:hypothetical protein
MKNILFALLMAFTSGCTTVGREVTEAQLTGFEKGKTTQSEVIAKLGQPNSTMLMPNGQRSISYVFAHAQARPESFIPIVGGFVGGADSRTTVATFIFNADGTLDTYTHIQSNSGAGYGLSAAPYQQPDRSQPQAQQ